MKLSTLFALLLLSAAVVTGRADDWAQLTGKWSLSKTNEQGQPYTQTIEIKKDHMTFKIVGGDGTTYIYAEGKVTLEKLGPFSTMKITEIEAGPSSSEKQSIGEERHTIYQIGYNKLTLAGNFERERDEGPVLDVYKKVKE